MLNTANASVRTSHIPKFNGVLTVHARSPEGRVELENGV